VAIEERESSGVTNGGNVAARRRGFTLLEAIAVLTLIGLFASIALVRIGPSTAADLSAQAEARRLALHLLQAQRRAILTGQNHFLQTTSQSGQIVGYTLYQRLGGGSTAAVDAYRAFPANVSAAVTPSDPEYAFDGSALAAYQVTLTAPDQTWRVTVVPTTGAVRVTQL
jgi:prepilin-type N-terminal cleavage/methylation domain-containing protein